MATGYYTHLLNYQGATTAIRVKQCGYDVLKNFLEPHTPGIYVGLTDPVNEYIKTYTDAVTAGWIPQWVKDMLNSNGLGSHYTTGSITFTYHNVKYSLVSLVTSQGDSNFIYLLCQIGSTGYGIYQISAYGEAYNNSYYNRNGDQIKFLLGNNGDQHWCLKKVYIVDREVSGSYTLNGTFKITPVNPADTNAYVMIYDGDKGRYPNLFFEGETTSQVYLYSENPMIEGSSFTTNYYNGKVPLYRVWANNATNGARGYVSSLKAAPNSYNTSSGQFTIDGVDYIGVLGREYGGTTYTAYNAQEVSWCTSLLLKV